jgi:hypothetical protein
MTRDQRHNRTRRSSGRSKLVRFFRRLGLFGIACVVLLVVYMILAKASRPFLISYAESREIAGIKREKDAVEAENRRLRTNREYLKTDQGKEAEARKLGWVKSGEVAVVVGQPEHSPTPPIEFEKPAPPKSKWRILSEKVMGKLLFRADKKKADKLATD